VSGPVAASDAAIPEVALISTFALGGEAGIQSLARALVERAAAADIPAFEALVRRHADAAFRTALAILRREADARDATQEAFVQAWRSIGRDRRGPGRP
jgi:hypothetical protein